MPKRIATVSTVVIREGKRVTVGPGTPNPGAFDFTDEEIKQITAIHATALRKPVNESTGTAETAPDGDNKPKANATPKKTARKKAAEADSTSKAANTAEHKSGETKDEGEGDEGDEDDANETETGDEDDDI